MYREQHLLGDCLRCLLGLDRCLAAQLFGLTLAGLLGRGHCLPGLQVDWQLSLGFGLLLSQALVQSQLAGCLLHFLGLRHCRSDLLEDSQLSLGLGWSQVCQQGGWLQCPQVD